MNPTNPYTPPESLCLDVTTGPPEPVESNEWSAGKRLLLTVGVIILVTLLGFLEIPLILLGGSVLGGPAYTRTGTTAFLSIGISPIVLAFILVELFALSIPTLRQRRLAGAEARAGLRQASLRLGSLLIFLQSLFHVWELRHNGYIGPEGLTFFFTAAALAAGSYTLLWLMRLVDRRGLGQGFSVVLAGVLLSWVLPRPWVKVPPPAAPPDSPLLGLALVVILAFLVFQSRPSTVQESFPRSLPLPTSGLQPLVLSTLGWGFLASLRQLFQSETGYSVLSALKPSSPGSYVVVLALAILFSILFNRPSHVREAWARNSPWPFEELSRHVRRLFWNGLLASAFLMLAGKFLQSLLDRQRVAIDVTALAGLAFISMDLLGEWRFRTTIAPIRTAWELHRVHAVDPVLAALREARIPAFPRGFRHRSLMHFFGPMVPVEILVPTEHEAEARSIVQKLTQPSR